MEGLSNEKFGFSNRLWGLAKPLLVIAKAFYPEFIPEIKLFLEEQLKLRYGKKVEIEEAVVLEALERILEEKAKKATYVQIKVAELKGSVRINR